MSQVDAPLYVHASRLLRALVERVRRWPERPFRLIGEPLCAEARALLGAIRCALVFPRQRRRHQRAADEALSRLRGLLTAAGDLGLLDDGAAAAFAEETTAIGRMLGGWRKRWRRGSAAAA